MAAAVAAIAPAAAVLAAAAPKLIYRLILGRHATAVAGEDQANLFIITVRFA